MTAVALDELLAPLLGFAAAALAVAGAGDLVLLRRGMRRPSAGGRNGGRGVRTLRLLARAGRRLRPAAAGEPAAPHDLAARIEAAGRPGGLGVREVMGAKLAAAVCGGLAGAVLGGAAPGRLGFALVVAGPVAGFLLPDVWLRRRAGERASRARRELPALLDLLGITLDAGLPLSRALASAGERSSGPVGAEWRAVGREVALGVPLAVAVERMTERLPLPEVETLAAALVRSARHGAPLADALAAQARDARLVQRRRVQEDAARAGPKIQLVVALLLVPSVLLMVAAALAGSLTGPGGAVDLR